MRRSWSPEAGAPALYAALAAGSGIALGVVCPVGADGRLLVCLLILAGAAFVMGHGRGVRSSSLAGAGALVLFLVAGFDAGRSRLSLPLAADSRLVASLPDDNLVTITGRLGGPWSASGSLRRGEMDVEKAEADGKLLPLSGPVFLLVGGAVDPLEVTGAGDRIRVSGALRIPEGDAEGRNPFSLPREGRLRIKSAEQIERLSGPSGLLAPVHVLHRAMTLRLKANVKDGTAEQRRAVSLLMALLLGETEDLPASTASAFRDGGVAHVLAISGLQIALLAATLHALLAIFSLALWQRDVAVLVATLIFSVFAGGGAPVVRAALMIGLYLAARLVGRPTSPWQVVGFAALVLLLFRPANLFDIGFLLTFGAVSGLAAFGPPASRLLRRAGVRPPIVADGLGATIGAEAAIFPVQAFVFNVVPYVSLLSNLLIVPLSNVYLFGGIALVPFLLLSPAAAHVAAIPLAAGANGLLALLDLLDRLRAFRFIPAPAFWEAAGIAALMALAAVLSRRFPSRAVLVVAAAWSAAVMFRPSTVTASGTSLFQGLDVGQGDAWLLVTPSGRVLVDGGGSYDTAYDFGRLKLLPKLARIGAVSFDAVVLTHPHPDHSRGLVSVLSLMPVGTLYVSRGAPANQFLDELLETARRRGVPVVRTGAGERFHAAGLDFDVLHPGPDPYPRSRENNSSLVLRVALGTRRVLLTGDIEGMAESDLLERGTPLSADLLKVCHHGSRTSTTTPFLSAVSPRAGVIGVGRHNRFGHPNAGVLERLRDSRVRVFRTDRDGDIGFLFRAGSLLPTFPAAVAAPMP